MRNVEYKLLLHIRIMITKKREKKRGMEEERNKHLRKTLENYTRYYYVWKMRKINSRESTETRCLVNEKTRT